MPGHHIQLRGAQAALAAAQRSKRPQRSSLKFLDVDERVLATGPQLDAAGVGGEVLVCTYAIVQGHKVNKWFGGRQAVSNDGAKLQSRMERERTKKNCETQRKARARAVGKMRAETIEMARVKVARRCSKSIVGSNEWLGARGDFVRETRDADTVRHSTRT